MKIEEIIEGCKKKKPKAQKALYDEFSGRLFALCLRYTHTREDAEDMFQEAFVKVFKAIDSYDYRGSFEGWLKRIFINYALNFYRSNKARLQTNNLNVMDNSLTQEEDENIEDSFFASFTVKEIFESLKLLPFMQRMVFNLVEVEDYSYEDVANKFGLSNACIRTHNSRAKRNLRYILLDIKQKKDKER